MTQVKIFNLSTSEGSKSLNDFLASFSDGHNREVTDVKFWGYSAVSRADDIYHSNFAAVVYKVFSI